MWLPVDPAPLQQKEMMPCKETILIVDDEPIALKYFAKLFGDRFHVIPALSAEEAMEIMESRKDGIDVVISDQRMPGGSGLELLKHVLQSFPDTPGILTTAYSEIDTLVQAINSGTVFSFVSKPWKIHELESTLTRAFACRGDLVRARSARERSQAGFLQSSLDLSVTKSGLIASKIGHYVNNAICPVVFLIDQLIANHCASESLPLDFLQSLKKHVVEVASTLAELEKVSGSIAYDSFGPVDIGGLLEEVLRETALMRQQKQLSLDLRTTGLIPPVRGVASQIEKMFRFMIAEELVSLPPGSRVNVRLSTEEKSGSGCWVKLEFEDYVPLIGGVPAGNFLHPFHLRGTDPRQFGVFLVSCYFIARNHGGRLTSETKKTAGLIYSIFLPCQGESVLDSVGLCGLY